MFQERGRRPETLRLVEQPETTSLTPEFKGGGRWAFRGLLLTANALSLALLLTVFAKQSHEQHQPAPAIPAPVFVGSFHSDSWFSNPETFSKVAELSYDSNMVILTANPLISHDISIANRSPDVIIALNLIPFLSWFDQQEKSQPHIGIIFIRRGDNTTLEGIPTTFTIDVESSFPKDTRGLQTLDDLEHEVALDLSARSAVGIEFTNRYGREAAAKALPHLDKLPSYHPARAIFDSYRTKFKSGKLQPFVKLVTINPFLPLRRSTPTILH